MKVIVDYRETNEDLIAILIDEGGLEIKFQQLAIGDYLLPNLLVERKTYNDFSIRDGRLFRQATNLSRLNIQPRVIIEAPRGSNFKHPVGFKAVRGAFITLSILFGVPVIRSRDSTKTAKNNFASESSNRKLWYN